MFVDARFQSIGVLAKAAISTFVESLYGLTLKPAPALVRGISAKSSRPSSVNGS